MGAEFATILTSVDSRGYCICKVVALGRATPDSVIDLYENIVLTRRTSVRTRIIFTRTLAIYWIYPTMLGHPTTEP